MVICAYAHAGIVVQAYYSTRVLAPIRHCHTTAVRIVMACPADTESHHAAPAVRIVINGSPAVRIVNAGGPAVRIVMGGATDQHR